MQKLYISCGINLFLAIFVIILLPYLPPIVPLLYGRAVGEEQLVKSIWLITPMVVSILISILNYFLSEKFIKDNFLKRILVNTSFFINILVIITVLKIIFLVGFFK